MTSCSLFFEMRNIGVVCCFIMTIEVPDFRYEIITGLLFVLIILLRTRLNGNESHSLESIR